ncbi:MAG: hypothetical protein HC913_21335 [Microscillaceae bacterium]|nr:hypothetical protein [Microscillaceae bacterium]
MDSFEGIGQFIFWALVIIYYLFSSLTSKKEVKKVPPTTQPTQKSVNPATGSTPRTLSDILREIQEQRKSPSAQVSEESESGGFKSETGAFSSESSVFKEEFRQDNFSWEEKGFAWEENSSFKPTPEPTIQSVSSKKKVTPRKVNPFREMFKDRESVRRAFIASEIFNRKF